MFRSRRYVRPRVKKAVEELILLLDEATILVQTLVLQQSGTSLERFKTLDFKKGSIDGLNDTLVTLKTYIKSKLHFLDSTIDDIREEGLKKIQTNKEFAYIMTKLLSLNLIADNNDISLYLAPYIDDWDLLSTAASALVLNHVIRSINIEIERAEIAQKLSEKF